MTGWTVIIPVRPWPPAAGSVDRCSDDRARLARAFSLDVLGAALGSAEVSRLVVVTAEIELAASARSAGAAVLVDRPMPGVGHLDRAIERGRRWAHVAAPQARVAVLPGDLPALTSGALDHALVLMGGHLKAFVPDADATGTTLLSAASPGLLVPEYGERSAIKHARSGSRPMLMVDPRCRRDVDTAADLVEATRLGLGDHTARAVQDVGSDEGCTPCSSRRATDDGRTPCQKP